MIRISYLIHPSNTIILGLASARKTGLRQRFQSTDLQTSPPRTQPLMEYLRRPPPTPERRSMGKVFGSRLSGLDRQSAVHDDAFAVSVAGRIRHQIQDGSGHFARLGVS